MLFLYARAIFRHLLFMRITIIGGGSWGTALGHLLAGSGNNVRLLLRSRDMAEEINAEHRNSRYLPGLALNPALQASTSPGPALDGAEICILAVPCQHMREALRTLAPFVPVEAAPICASKGIETANLCRMSEVTAAEWPRQAARYAVLSGPSFAREVVEGKPTAVVLAAREQEHSEALRSAFSSEFFRVYSSTDVPGVELGGAVKNVIALTAGLCDGLGFGDNGRAALITRGLAEMTRLGLALGARPLTFMGLSGMGDLVLTCTGGLSRNRQVGLRLAAGESLAAITSGMHMVAEGVATCEALCRLAERHGLELPVTRAMYKILYQQADPQRMARDLMTRDLREE